MNYYIQTLCISTLTWIRETDEDPFDCALDALERADEIAANWPNDGNRRAIRVVDDNGKIHTYEQ